jgi:hypothetical protein
MTTIMCTDCNHVVFIQMGRGWCSHCQAEYEVEIRQTKKSPLPEEVLKDRSNIHRG